MYLSWGLLSPGYIQTERGGHTISGHLHFALCTCISRLDPVNVEVRDPVRSLTGESVRVLSHQSTGDPPALIRTLLERYILVLIFFLVLRTVAELSLWTDEKEIEKGGETFPIFVSEASKLKITF